MIPRDPFVAFVGAGASVLPPSRLPSWTEFNSLLLESLCDKVANFSGGRQPTDEILSAFRARRDNTNFFPPDFQAQLMEEEVGTEYFRVWQSLDTTVYGPVHAGLAELVTRGKLAAIITTNFDRLIEKALLERGQAFNVFHDQVGFDALAMPNTSSRNSVLPIIKIHGSIEDPTSLIDTLKQRIVGRPKSLTDVLRILLREHVWLYLGFSGSDFSYDPGYLGILDAAKDAKGFVFLAREGSTVQAGVHQIATAYGTEKAVIVYGDLSTWLPKTFDFPEPKLPSSEIAGVNDYTAPSVRSRIQQWVDHLGSLAAVNILCSMLRCSGMETHAHWLLRKTWRSYRSDADTPGKSYARYNYNYGLSLFEAGYISNPVPLAADRSNLLEWLPHADQNACEFLGRSYITGELLAAAGHMAGALAYRGEVGKAISLAAKVTDEALAKNAKMDLCEIAIACVPIYDIVRLFDPAAAQLSGCLGIAKELGDEPRRAMLCAYLGRFLTYGGHFGEADEFIVEAERIAHRLDLREVLLTSQASRGRWLTDSGTSDELAVRTLRSVAKSLDEAPLFVKVDLSQPNSEAVVIKGRHPALCRVLLDLVKAARFAGDAETVNQTLDDLDGLVPNFVGYGPHYYLSFAECLLYGGDKDQKEFVDDLIRRARELGRLTSNPWVDQAADRLEGQANARIHSA